MPEIDVQKLIKKLDNYMKKYGMDNYMQKMELISLEIRNPELSYWFITSTATTNRDSHLEIIYSTKNYEVMFKLVEEYSRLHKDAVDYRRISDEFLATADLHSNYLLYDLFNLLQKKELADRHQGFIEAQMSKELDEPFTFVYPFVDCPSVDERNEWFQKVQQLEMIQLTRNISSEQNN